MKITIYSHPQFNSEFPELFNWNLVDSVSLSKLADDLSIMVQVECRQATKDRGNVAGLRVALRQIAQRTTVEL